MTLEECKKKYGANITPHFKYWEFIYSKKAEEHGIDNNPPDFAYNNIETLTKRLLEPLRVYYGKPIEIAGKGGSGYRCDKLNDLVGGSKGSHHRFGFAADCHVDKPLSLLKSLLKSGLDFDQAIVYPTFLHIGLKAGANRRQVKYNQSYKGKREVPEQG